MQLLICVYWHTKKNLFYASEKSLQLKQKAYPYPTKQQRWRKRCGKLVQVFLPPTHHALRFRLPYSFATCTHTEAQHGIATVAIIQALHDGEGSGGHQRYEYILFLVANQQSRTFLRNLRRSLQRSI